MPVSSRVMKFGILVANLMSAQNLRHREESRDGQNGRLRKDLCRMASGP